MPSAKVSFKHTEAARLMRAAKAAGFRVTNITLDAGKVTLAVDDTDAASDPEQLNNPLDRVLDHAESQKRAS